MPNVPRSQAQRREASAGRHGTTGVGSRAPGGPWSDTGSCPPWSRALRAGTNGNPRRPPGRTRCGRCRTLVYVGAVKRESGGDRARRPARRQPPGRDRVPIRPRSDRALDLSTPTSPGLPLLAVLETFVERWAKASSDRPASVPPVAPVSSPVATSVPNGPTVAVRLRCGHTAQVLAPRGSVIGRELICPSWSGPGSRR
jgi:hypothetical protein